MRFQFEDFVLDADRRELRRGGPPIAVQPQVFDLLLHAIEQRHRVVSRDDLIDVVWNGRIVSESTLATRINAARRAIGDSGREQRLLRTVARKGIRFVGAVTTASAPEAPGGGGTGDVSIAIMPLSVADDDLRDVAERLAGDIATASCGHLTGIGVHYPGTASPDRVAPSRYALLGGVSNAGEAVRVSLQVVEASSAAMIWADAYTRPLPELRRTQQDLAATVASAVLTAVSAREGQAALRQPLEGMSAEACFHRARRLLRNYTQADNLEAERLLKHALGFGTEPAKIHGALSLTFLERCSAMWGEDVAADIEQVRRHALRALDLDAGSILPRTLLSFHEIYRGRREVAVAEMERAEALIPPNTFPRTGGSAILAYVGRLDEALAWVEADMRRNALHDIKYFLNRGRTLYLMGKPLRAIDDLEQVASSAPHMSNLRILLAAANDAAGRTAAASGLIAAQLVAVPWTTIRRIRLVTPFPEPQLTAFVAFLRRYGVPEGEDPPGRPPESSG